MPLGFPLVFGMISVVLMNRLFRIFARKSRTDLLDFNEGRLTREPETQEAMQPSIPTAKRLPGWVSDRFGCPS